MTRISTHGVPTLWVFFDTVRRLRGNYKRLFGLDLGGSMLYDESERRGVSMKLQARNAIRSAIAVVAGYLTMAVLVMFIFLLLGIIFPKAFPADGALPRVPWVIFILIWNLFSAIAGAYVTSLVCRGSRIKHVLALLAVVLVLGLIVLAGNVNKQPVWYLIAQIVVGVIGVMIGGSIPVQGKDPREHTMSGIRNT